MGYGRAHMKDEAFRALVYYEVDGEPRFAVLGPYATVGAARGQATAKKGSIERWGGGRVDSITIQRATGWENVE